MEGALAVGLVLSGRVREGIKFLESAIAARDADGFRSMAAWNRRYTQEAALMWGRIDRALKGAVAIDCAPLTKQRKSASEG